MWTNKNMVIELEAPDEADKIHTNGDKLHGHVHVLPNARLNLTGMSIHFKGKIKSRVDVKTGSGQNTIANTYCAKVLLFDFENDLTMRNAQSVHRWPFEFKIPWTSLPVAHNPKTLGPHPFFEHEPGFPLPAPTNQGRKNGYQEIKCYLEVIGNAPTALFRKKPKNRLYIKFTPSLCLPTPPCVMLFTKSTPLSRESTKLDPWIASQRPSFSQRASHFLSTSNEPYSKASFTIHSTIPTKACPGDPFPITLSIKHNTESSTTPGPPIVTFEALSARLLMTTDGRVPSEYSKKKGQQYHTVRHQPAKWEKLFFHKNRAIPLNPGEQLHLQDHLTDMVLPEDLEPGFRTYNVARFYRINIMATFHCVGESYDVALTRDVDKKDVAPLFEVLPKLKRERREFELAKKPVVVKERDSLEERLEKLSPSYRTLMKQNRRRVKESKSLEHLDRLFPWPPYDEIENAARLG